MHNWIRIPNRRIIEVSNIVIVNDQELDGNAIEKFLSLRHLGFHWRHYSF
jgi:hypothetical protein